ncbi:MAG: hypothetical protein AAGH41_05730 [Pseudomonadota bacterium]
MVKRPNRIDCNWHKHMVRALFCSAAFLTLGCASQAPEMTEADRRFQRLAAEKSRGAPFPVLGVLTAPDDLGDKGLPPGTGDDIRALAAVLAGLNAETEPTGPGLDEDPTVVELQALIRQVQGTAPRLKPRVDVEALDFPTPPPVE